MGKKYTQLDLDERIELDRLRDAGYSFRRIGRLMHRSHTTIGRELRRNNLPKAGYKPARADKMAYVRCKRHCKLERLSTLATHVSDHLAMGWSPEQIAGRLRHTRAKHTISHETIYRYIYRSSVRKNRLYRYLPRAKTKRGLRYFKRRRNPIPQRMNIANRPQSIENRQEFGHWEGDLMQFRTQRGNILTLCERKTRLIATAPLPSKAAEPTAQALQETLGGLPQLARKSITFDRGGEFAHHETIRKGLNVDVWYCDPHSPWQRGTIENTNGLLRRDLPRKTNFNDYTEQDIQNLTFMLNSTPRKCLGFKTPAEAFMENINGALEM